MSRSDRDPDATLDSRQVEGPSVALIASVVLVFDGAHAVQKAHRVHEQPMIVGRQVEGVLDVAVDDKHASRKHVSLKLNAKRRVIEMDVLSDRGALHNGARVTGTLDVRDNDVIRVGHSIFVVRFDDARGDAKIPGLQGQAPVMMEVRRELSQMATSGRDLPLLLLGESGTGKEVAARAYAELCRPQQPFIAVNCGAIPESLAESELFGHVAGAFTGAQRDHAGVFRSAHKGVLFLDEIGELPINLQPKLLRALEQREVTPVGGKAPIAVDVRVVSATNRDLRDDIDDGKFRGDLYARLAGLVIEMPALRERREDILALIAPELGDVGPLDVHLAEALLLYDWPFNVRELKKIGGELAVKGRGRSPLTLDLIEDRLKRERPKKESTPVSSSSPLKGKPRRVAPDEEQLRALIQEHGNNVSAIARATGRSRMQVYRWMKKHGLDE
jgi:DNA-binding NtrC family response regulator